jgi:PAS domain S-box-containing protein
MIKQNKLKQTIENQKETFENLYRKSTDGIVLIEDGKFIDCNESILKMLGFKDKEQFLNIDPSKLSPKYQPDGKTSFKKRSEMIDIALKEGSNSFEWIHIKADGSEFWVEIVLTKININDKDIIHLVLRDIEKRKKAEEELSNLNEILELKVKEEVEKNRQKDKQMLAQSRLAQMGEMISMIAHQWRQPLTAIGSTAINLKFKLELESYDLNKKEDRKECEEYFINELNDIEKYTHNLTTTIEDFRNFYKPNKEYKALSIKKPLEIALNIIKGSLDSNNIKLTTQFESVNIINMYDSELMQVFLNILKNAQDSFKEQHIENKQIIIKTKDLEDGINISIFNNGIPIRDDVLPKIFDPYFSTKLEKNGTGLGLYMSKTIIEEHHKGKIEAVNHTDGVAFEIIIRSV